jgi:hypothetical protein
MPALPPLPRSAMRRAAGNNELPQATAGTVNRWSRAGPDLLADRGQHGTAAFRLPLGFLDATVCT